MADQSGLGALTLSADELEAFDSLTPAEQAEYVDLLAQVVGPEWELAPKQRFAEAVWNKVDWLLFGGAASGGKSELAIKHTSDLSTRVPGHVSLIVRQSIPELRRSIILRLVARVKQFRIPAKLRKVDGVTSFRFENDSLIECGYLATDEHLGNYLSAEYDLIVIDEASLMTENQIVQLAARLRTTNTKAALGARPHLGLFSNPGGRSHAWLYQMFVTATEYGNSIVVYNVAEGFENATIARVYRAPATVADASVDTINDILIPWIENLKVHVDPSTELAVAFVPAKATDNPHVAPGYMKYLNALPERRRRQLRDGDWDTFEGQYFAEWNRDIHVVKPFDIPEGWQRGRGADFGSAAPWCCLWGAWDNDGNCYIYREAYGAGLNPAQQAREAKRLSELPGLNGKPVKERYTASVADPSVFSDRRGTGKSIADLWRDNGFHVTRAKNARIAGWQNVHQYLWDDQLARPRLFVFDTCPNLIRTIPLMQHDSKKNEDLDTTLEDHACLAPWTLVKTRRGQVRIDAVRVDDEVMTRNGWQGVGWVGVTGHKPLVRVAGVDCTGDHPFLTDRGWVAARSVTHSDILTVCPPTSRPFSRRRSRNTEEFARPRLPVSSKAMRQSRANKGRRLPSEGGVEWSGTKSFAAYAERRPRHRSQVEPSSAVSTVARPTSDLAAVPLGISSDVWNLVVDGDAHEYFANGVLVSNCDAARYLLYIRPIGSKPPKSKIGLDINERFARVVQSAGRKPKGRLFS
jgi:hypothetical protein